MPHLAPSTTPQRASAPGAAERHPGFQIGWDHARFALDVPASTGAAAQLLQQGWRAAKAVFGPRTRRATPQVRQWLALRTTAWQRGEAFDDGQITPNVLARLAVSHCPVTGDALTHDTGGAADAVIERANPQAGWAAGNLLMFSRRVQVARGALDWRAALERARQPETSTGAEAVIGGLRAHEWLRLAVLMSFATPLAHATACALPLVVLPPPRLRVLNPAQALQVLLTLRFVQGAQPARLDEIGRLLPEDARGEFFVLGTTLMARRIAAGSDEQPALRHAMALAWRQPLVQQRWQRLALRLDALSCERVVQAAVARGLAGRQLRCLSLAQATEGWALPGGVQAPHAVQRLLPPRAPCQDEGLTLPAMPIHRARRSPGARPVPRRVDLPAAPGSVSARSAVSAPLLHAAAAAVAAAVATAS